jgi:hypothetical protein
MLFKPNTMLSITDTTRSFRVRDTVLETWMMEGTIPECVWRNGRRYWSSDEFNSCTKAVDLCAQAKKTTGGTGSATDAKLATLLTLGALVTYFLL